MGQALNKEIVSVRELLSKAGLTIPVYQRPYKWSLSHVNQLFQDLDTQRNKSAYRLGTLVFHRHSENTNKLNIVDGQQRTLTLMLAALALIEERPGSLERQDLQRVLDKLREPITTFMKAQIFDSDISQHNLHQNYREIIRIVSRSDFTEDHIDFLLNRCEVVTFTLTDISEAFQFFDSQNARGRDLAPHDLLKAYHLREFSEEEQGLKADTVAGWESMESGELAELFAEYLYRVRRWAQWLLGSVFWEV